MMKKLQFRTYNDYLKKEMVRVNMSIDVKCKENKECVV